MVWSWSTLKWSWKWLNFCYQNDWVQIRLTGSVFQKQSLRGKAGNELLCRDGKVSHYLSYFLTFDSWAHKPTPNSRLGKVSGSPIFSTKMKDLLTYAPGWDEAERAESLRHSSGSYQYFFPIRLGFSDHIRIPPGNTWCLEVSLKWTDELEPWCKRRSSVLGYLTI